MRPAAPKRVRIIAAMAIALAACGLAPSAAGAFDHEGLARRTLQNHIVPGYRALLEAAAKQTQALGEACEAPGASPLESARAAFKAALLAWGRIEHIRFGPIADENRYERLLFWPDPRGIARRQVSRLLARHDGKVPSVGALSGKSAAVQGFTALDILLYGPGSEKLAGNAAPPNFPCQYAHAVAAGIERMAADTLAGWTSPSGFAKAWLNPGPNNAAFLTATETTHAIAQAYLTGLAQLRNVRLGGPLGFKDRGMRPLVPVVPHSGVALDLAIANIEGLRALLVQSGLASPAAAGAPAHDAMQSVVTEMDLMIPSIRKVMALARRPFEDTAARNQLVLLGFPLKNAHEIVAAYLAKEAGLSMGFNSLDGD